MSDDGATFSWGTDEDYDGKTIDANATELHLPISATDADIALLAQRCKQLQALNLQGCDKITDAGFTSANCRRFACCSSTAASSSPTTASRISPHCSSW